MESQRPTPQFDATLFLVIFTTSFSLGVVSMFRRSSQSETRYAFSQVSCIQHRKSYQLSRDRRSPTYISRDKKFFYPSQNYRLILNKEQCY